MVTEVSEQSINYFLLTIPARSGISFSETGTYVEGVMDGIRYKVQGSYDLLTFDGTVEPHSQVVETGLPVLEEGWDYRTFRLGREGRLKGFMRVQLTEDAGNP